MIDEILWKGGTGLPKSTLDQLRDLLRQQAEAAGDEAAHSAGKISPGRVDELRRLAHLVEICEAAQPQPARKRWPVIVSLGATLLIVSVLLFARIAETEIELDLTLSEVGFVLPKQQVFAETMGLSALGVSGLREIQFLEAPNTVAQMPQSSDRVRLSVASGKKHQGSITLATLMLPSETRLWLRHAGAPHQYRLSLKGANLELRADVHGLVEVGFPDRGAEQFDFVTPQPIHMLPGMDDVDLDLTLPDPDKSAFSPQVSVTNLSLFQINEYHDDERSVVRRVSSILSGTLIFESLGQQELKLRPGEMIHFEQVRGEIRTLRLKDDSIDLKFHGRVRGLGAGSEESLRSLMPTWLEWLRARHSLSLFWGAAIYLFGLIAGVLRWWGKPI
jgi:hypothetical protein